MRDKRPVRKQRRTRLLDIAGFDATVKEAAGGEGNRTWGVWFDELVEYKSVVGSCEVPENRVDAGLGLWVQRQRVKRAEGTLSAKALARLLALGVSFEGYSARRTANRRTTDRRTRSRRGREREKGGDARLRAVERGDEEAVVDDDAVPLPSRSARESALDRRRSRGRFFKRSRRSAASSPSHRSGQSSPCGWRTCETARRPSARRTRRGIKNKACPRRSATLLRGYVEPYKTSTSVWLGELEAGFASLRAHRVILHDPKALAALRRERAANAGLCSRAQRCACGAVGMSGVAGALLLDDLRLRGVDECLSADALAQSGPYGAGAAAEVWRRRRWRRSRCARTRRASHARTGARRRARGVKGWLRCARARPRRRGGEDPEAPKAGGRGERKARLFGRAVRARCVAGPRGAGDARGADARGQGCLRRLT